MFIFQLKNDTMPVQRYAKLALITSALALLVACAQTPPAAPAAPQPPIPVGEVKGTAMQHTTASAVGVVQVQRWFCQRA